MHRVMIVMQSQVLLVMLYGIKMNKKVLSLSGSTLIAFPVAGSMN
jgi:hypothetical protein